MDQRGLNQLKKPSVDGESPAFPKKRKKKKKFERPLLLFFFLRSAGALFRDRLSASDLLSPEPLIRR